MNPQKQQPMNSYTAATGRAMQSAFNPNVSPVNVPTQTTTPQSSTQPTQPPISNNGFAQPLTTPVNPTPIQPQTQPNIAPQTQPIQSNPATTPQPQQPITSVVAAAPAPVNPDNPLSTQATLMLSELRDSLVIMKDGSFRAVIACQSINFDLMSDSEREGVEYSYQNFLNSLNFPVQILVRSQRVDISPYISRLSNMRRENDNMLLGVLMDDYLQFIQILAQEANIMDKSFFIVIPFYSSSDLAAEIEQTKNFFRVMSRNSAPPITKINRDVYNKAIEELNNRVETVVGGLYRIGIQSVRLNTRELSELFYNFNNPDTAVRQPLVDFTEIATTFVRKGEKDA